MNKRILKFMAAASAVVLAASGRGTAVLAAPEIVSEAVPGNTSDSLPKSVEKSTYIVDQNGQGDFTTIQEAVDSASDGDTLVICPGVYTEDVRVMNKQLDLAGTSRDFCILQCDAGSYRKTPLTMAAGKVSNLTIYGMDTKAVQGELSEAEIAEINAQIEGDSWERQKNFKGYAVHVDQNYLCGRSISFENCRIVSENNHCAGIGGRGKSVISFENCELVSLGGGSCIYLHDAPLPEISGEMALIMKNCDLKSYLCPYVMTFQSYLPECNTMNLTFRNNRVRAVAFAECAGYVPFNANSFFDVETLMELEDMGALYMTGLSSTAAQLVHETEPGDSAAYMLELEGLLEKGNAYKALTTVLPEGITYLGDSSRSNTGIAKHQMMAIYNRSGMAGNGWCGLDNAYLTQDSFGNTLPEMNTVYIINNFSNSGTADSVSGLNPAAGH